MKMKKMEIIIFGVIFAGAVGSLLYTNYQKKQINNKVAQQAAAQQETVPSETAMTELGITGDLLEGITETDMTEADAPLVDMGSIYIYANGQDFGVFPLNVDQTIKINDTNVVEIKDGQARMIEATCPDHICVEGFPPIDAGGGMIVCLPNEVLIEGIRPEASTELVVDSIAQ